MSDYTGTEELFLIEESLNNYNEDIVKKLSEFLRSCPKALPALGFSRIFNRLRCGASKSTILDSSQCDSEHVQMPEILEFGAGIGTLAKIWCKHTGIVPECLEIDKNLGEIIKKRGFKCYNSLEELNKRYDGIYSSNVLEHIEDDVAVIKKLHSQLKNNGVIAIYVPAFKILYSGLDESVGHVRRYEKFDLVTKLQQANFQIIKCHFADSLGFFASLALKIFGYTKSQKNFYFYDKYIYPISRLLDILGARYFFGKNLLVIAKKI